MKPSAPIPNILQQSEEGLVQTTQDLDWWKGITLRRLEFTSDYSIQRPAHNGCHVAYFSTGRNRLIQKRGGKVHEGRTFAGMAIIAPKGYVAAYEGDTLNVTTLRVPNELMSRAADEIGRRSANYEIINIFQTRDATIGHLTSLFLSELDRPAHPAQALISESLSNALAWHLLRSYNVFDLQEHPTSGLGPRLLSEVIAYIEDHTDATIRLDKLASIAGASRFHFLRLFKASTGITPMAYVEQSRIRKAEQLILSGELTLAEIALIVGFADQSHFTRRFQLHIGCTPAVFARNKGTRFVRTSNDERLP